MIKDKVISISELRSNATKIIENLPKTGDQYIFVHNKPKAVLVDIDWFETVSQKYNKHGIEYINPDIFEIDSIKEYESRKKKGDLEYVEAFSFLDSL
ncbi:type II toxin-antitoxin system Phd/YefM family antitoxin [Candidatus Gracilibacteria bacterium 28_42_T64]|nr:type II toxin-antitoxin system Phd/YefM family antitoxin [Candidatus Gracilibacteria bacterium 28_42_T64]